MRNIFLMGAFMSVIVTTLFGQTTNHFCSILTEPSINFGNPNDSVKGNDKFYFNLDELKSRRDDFYLNFKYSTSEPPFVKCEKLANAEEQMIINNLDKIYNDVTKSSFYDIKDHKIIYNHDKDFSGIKIHYGLDNSNQINKMVLFYEPILLHPNGKTQHHLKKYNIDTTGIFYKLDTSGNLQNVAYDGFKPYYQKYINLIRINHKNGQLHFVRNDFKLSKGDITYCIIPLKQIIAMYNANTHIDSSKIGQINHSILFSLIASDDFTKSKNNFKLHIVASYNIKSKSNIDAIKNKKDQDNYDGYGADFTQMCPPNPSYVLIEN